MGSIIFSTTFCWIEPAPHCILECTRWVFAPVHWSLAPGDSADRVSGNPSCLSTLPASVPLSPLPVWFLCGSYPSLGAEMVRDQVQKRLVSLPDSTVTQGVRVIQTPQGAGLHFMSCIWMKIRKNHLPLLQSKAVGFRVSWWADVFKIMCVGFINWTSIHGPLTKAKASRTRYPVCLSQALHRTWTYAHIWTHEHIPRGLEGWLPNIYRGSAGPAVLRIWKYQEHQCSQCPYLHRFWTFTLNIYIYPGISLHLLQTRTLPS